MSFCSNCGSEVKEGQAICLSCGFALKSNVKPKTETTATDLELSDRVEHNVFKLWPAFSDGPVGRMNYFVSLLKLTGMALVAVFALSIAGQVVEGNNGPAQIAFGIMGLFGIFGFVIFFVHQIALVYKRIWDCGFDETGTRVGLTIGYYVIGMIPFLNLLTLALFFIPARRN
jgi:uncharacterized membrane protein YhaH (DUF805 family)